MAICPKRHAAVAALALGAVALPAIGIGQERPESILPPGFGEPSPPPATRPAPRPSPTPGTPVPSAPSAPGAAPVVPAAPSPSTAVVQPLPPEYPVTSNEQDAETPAPTIDPQTLAEYEMPAAARRSLAMVGPTGAAEGGLPSDAFAGADGRYLEQLMRRLAAPLPSRWMSILLRRTLLSTVETPKRVNGADFAAERAWLLLRMGESVAARALVQNVDTANYTPKLYDVAMNAMLATGDPAGLCPLQPRAVVLSPARSWTLAGAMCAALTGQAADARSLLAQARKRRVATGIDLQLTQKVIGAGPGGRQMMTIEWAGVDRLTAWRFGLSTAMGVAIPDDMMASVGTQALYWRALSPAVAPADRLSAAEGAAAQGVLSNAALVDLYGAVDQADDAPSAAAAVAADLRTAFTGDRASARLSALRQLWGTQTGRVPYARLVLTAHAAARAPIQAGSADADRLIASMLSVGMDRTAARWRGAVEAGGDGWAMLQLSDPDLSRRLTYRDLAGYTGQGDAALKQRLLFAGLAGLGRLAPADVERAAEALDVRIGAENAWTRALDRAAMAGQPGTVVVLAALGMQTGSWKGVPPEMLYRIVGALRSVGLGGEARMIAAEALARA
ncbi:hypothetical protein SAMN05192583_0732 [Sphingomonas gellani]|uniref:Uncharacterized protein n=1 Tax=Sphingomonas gellani TaxID=1166340 RepID=A0A1H7ZMJ2_9SPHN|nr:hypothetical protein [Sphingomonas gellani]SEM58667.1 hypothetical protein SAMN05192583_0732 [Sphingomonas gellani]